MRIRVAFGIIVAVTAAVVWWWFVYTADLPNIEQLAEFAPAQKTLVTDPCTHSTNPAVPSTEINENVRKAVAVSELPATDPGFARYLAFDRAYCQFINEPREITLWEQIKHDRASAATEEPSRAAVLLRSVAGYQSEQLRLWVSSDRH